jgi:hypothetical protein
MRYGRSGPKTDPKPECGWMKGEIGMKALLGKQLSSHEYVQDDQSTRMTGGRSEA